MNSKKKIILILCLMTSLVLLDQWSKYLAIKHLSQAPTINYLGGFFKLTFTRNYGAWGSLGSDWKEPLKSGVLLYLPGVFLIGLIIFTLLKKGLTKYETLSFSFITAGGVGNLIDRIQQGSVVDMFWFGIREYRYLQTNIFNIADVVIIIGAGFMLVNQIQISMKNKKKKTT